MKQVAFVLVFLSTFIGNTQIDKSKYDEIDDKDLILKMHFTNEDLAESGHKIVSHMYLKQLIYNDKNNSKTATRMKDVKKLEKYYQELI